MTHRIETAASGEGDLNAKIIAWMAGGDTGLSSETIALWISQRATLKRWGPYTPSDPSDLGRCLRLLRAIPELRDRMGEMAECSPRWAHMLTYWHEIEQSMIDEVGADWEKGREAPKTYDLMHLRESEFST